MSDTKDSKKSEPTFGDHRSSPEFKETAYSNPNVLLSQTSQFDTTNPVVDYSGHIGVVNGIVNPEISIVGEPGEEYATWEGREEEEKEKEEEEKFEDDRPTSKTVGEGGTHTVPVVPVSDAPREQPFIGPDAVEAHLKQFPMAPDPNVTFPSVIAPVEERKRVGETQAGIGSKDEKVTKEEVKKPETKPSSEAKDEVKKPETKPSDVKSESTKSAGAPEKSKADTVHVSGNVEVSKDKTSKST